MSSTSIFLIIVASAFFSAFLATYLLIRAGGWLRILDYPNDRSLHTVPTPRTGGLAIWTGLITGFVLAVILVGVIAGFAWLIVALLMVGIVSLQDDRSHVPVKIRLAVHVFSGTGLILMGNFGPPNLGFPGLEISLRAEVAAVLWIMFCVWMINLYNFMDGIDGFAGGMAVVGFSTMGFLGVLAGDAQFAALSWAVAGAAAGFLVFNFPPARIFMGDTGASLLGLLAASLSLWADRHALFPLWISVLVFSPFIVDASVTLVRRLFSGERVWEAHRSHYYQRLARTGWGHRRTVLWGYGVIFMCSIAAVAAMRSSAGVQWLILCSISMVYVIAFIGVRRLETRLSET